MLVEYCVLYPRVVRIPRLLGPERLHGRLVRSYDNLALEPLKPQVHDWLGPI